MSCEQVLGELKLPDGSPVSFDGLTEHRFKMQFDKIPNTMFFLQGVTFPGISIQRNERPTGSHFDLQEIGSKVVFGDLNIQFLVDLEFKNHNEIFQWMDALTKSTAFNEQVTESMLFIGDKKYIRFIDIFPTSLGSVQFRTNVLEPQYVVCQATFTFDWYELLSV